MTHYTIGLMIAAGYVGWWIEHRRWCKPSKRHSVYVRDHTLARDKVFLDGLQALIDKAWASRTSNQDDASASEPKEGTDAA